MLRNGSSSLAVDSLAAAALVLSLGVVGCATGGSDAGSESEGQSGAGGAPGAGSAGAGAGAGAGGDIVVGGSGGEPSGGNEESLTCGEAAEGRAYVGCEFWPTVTFNPLYDEFDFAVVVANGQSEAADIEVVGPNGFSATAKIESGNLATIVLPWVSALKGPEFSRTDTTNGRVTESVRADDSAYRVTSSVPVSAWQFNPLQYKKPLGEFSQCGTTFGTTDCFSASNDASLLLPSTAMTGNYRVAIRSEIRGGANGEAYTSNSGAIAITATRDNTEVEIAFPEGCGAETWNPPALGPCVASGAGVNEANGGDVVTYSLSAGDVLQLLGEWGQGYGLKHADLSGTVIQADAPVQVIALNPITNLPDSAANADHIEETLLPGEVLGKTYIVTAPTAPAGSAKGGHIVRLYGNVNGTVLTYPEGQPSGAPTTLDAGEVAEFGPTLEGFVVDGSETFVVASFMLGGTLQGFGSCPDYPCTGDPAMSLIVTPEQFRTDYTFLAPADYDSNFADVLVPDGATATLDGAPLTGSAQQIGNSGWSLIRTPLDSVGGGIHRLHTDDDRGLGLQVMGFGHATSYYYPGGMNLELIAPPAEIPR
jgi:hypothetical protein